MPVVSPINNLWLAVARPNFPARRQPFKKVTCLAAVLPSMGKAISLATRPKTPERTAAIRGDYTTNMHPYFKLRNADSGL
jgi:hypothetical protein